MASHMKASAIAICCALSLAGGLKAATKAAEIYIVDVGHGDAAFVISPSGQTLMLDAGPTGAAKRILAFMQQNGIGKIDYLVVSHFEDDHMGAAPVIAGKVPILNWVDHGQSIVYGKDDDWWKQRRGPWAKPGMGKRYDESFDIYRKAVSAGGKVLSSPLRGVPGAGAPNPACAGIDRRAEDDAEDGQSAGVIVGLGEFRLAWLGDLTWNNENRLFCPNNLVGTVDAYIITHHGQSMPATLGDYYYGLSCCPPSEVHGLHPRVSILSLGSLGHREGTPDAMQTVGNSPGMEDLWETQKVMQGGERTTNPPDEFIANIGERTEQVPYIKITANTDGSFTVMNSRNQFSKKYAARAHPR